MRIPPWHVQALMAIIAATFIPALAFAVWVVGDVASWGYETNFFSVWFGWQWLSIAAIGATLLFWGISKGQKYHLRAAIIIAACLAAVLLPSVYVEKSKLYITGDGGPAGPMMSCLTWDNPRIVGEMYDKWWETECAIVSMPSYNKFLIDQSRWADQQTGWTFYVMLAINEVILLGGTYAALRQTNRRE